MCCLMYQYRTGVLRNYYTSQTMKQTAVKLVVLLATLKQQKDCNLVKKKSRSPFLLKTTCKFPYL